MKMKQQCELCCNQSTDHLLDEGVVCGVHAGAQRIKTLSVTVVG